LLAGSTGCAKRIEKSCRNLLDGVRFEFPQFFQLLPLFPSRRP
jgi:hypothetical protein